MNKKRISTDNYIYIYIINIIKDAIKIKNKKYEIKNPLDELTTYQMKTRLVYTNSGLKKKEKEIHIYFFINIYIYFKYVYLYIFIYLLIV